MSRSRIILFQILLIILAFAFTLAIRYITSDNAVPAGNFGKSRTDTVTVSEAVASIMPGEQVKE